MPQFIWRDTPRANQYAHLCGRTQMRRGSVTAFQSKRALLGCQYVCHSCWGNLASNASTQLMSLARRRTSSGGLSQ